MMETVRWGIIGAGNVCEVKSAPAMQRIPGSEIVAVMRRNAAMAQDYAERHGIARWYSHAEELLADPQVNAVYIATPPSSHAALTQMAAKAGYPVYVEKPMARTYAACLAMVETCKAYRVPLYVAYYRRYLPNYRFIKELVASDAIGQLQTYSIELFRQANAHIDTSAQNWRVQPDVAGDGYFYDLASHQLDYLDFLLGEVTHATGIAVNQAGLYPANDLVTGVMQHSNGVVGTGTWCFTAGRAAVRDITTLTGSKGFIRFPTYDGSFVEVAKNGQELKRYDFERPAHIQQPLIQAVVHDLRSGTEACVSTGVSAARTNRVMEWITPP